MAFGDTMRGENLNERSLLILDLIVYVYIYNFSLNRRFDWREHEFRIANDHLSNPTSSPRPSI